MAYRVIKAFKDKTDGNKLYTPGNGVVYASDDSARITFLAENGYIEKKESAYPKHVGGGWYELADGSKVQGKDEAISAMREEAGSE